MMDTIKKHAKKWGRDPLNNFAAACYDQNTVADLHAALKAPPDAADCRNWGISGAEWREAVTAALADMSSTIKEGDSGN